MQHQDEGRAHQRQADVAKSGASEADPGAQANNDAGAEHADKVAHHRDADDGAAIYAADHTPNSPADTMKAPWGPGTRPEALDGPKRAPSASRKLERGPAPERGRKV